MFVKAMINDFPLHCTAYIKMFLFYFGKTKAKNNQNIVERANVIFDHHILFLLHM